MALDRARGSQVELIPDAGHFLHIEQHAQVNRLLLRYLQQARAAEQR